MEKKVFQVNDQMKTAIRELCGHMPGGFFIYRAQAPEELLYANKPVFDIYGCDGLEDFKKLTGYTFRGMVHPEDYAAITSSISEQIESSDDKLDLQQVSCDTVVAQQWMIAVGLVMIVEGTTFLMTVSIEQGGIEIQQ